jgi:type II secretory pathway pseudopilin PulG
MALARGGWRNARGMMLLETIVVVTVFAMVGTAVMMGLNTTYATGTNTQSQSTAENLARNQMEYIFAQAYSAPGDADYAVITPPVGYDVTAAHDYVDPLNPDPDIEKITVTISRDSVDILVLETYRFAD